MQGYLGELAAAVRDAIAADVPIGGAAERVGEAAAGWLLTDEFHGRNVIAAFKELEWE